MNTNAVQCYMGLYRRIISHSTNLNIYSSGFWNFVAGRQRTMCSDDCQDNAALYDSNEKIFAHGFSMINSKNMVLDGKGKGSLCCCISGCQRRRESGWDFQVSECCCLF